MLAMVVSRHGDRFLTILLPLQITFDRLHAELMAHMAKEDAVLFPTIVAAAFHTGIPGGASALERILGPVQVMEAEHESAGTALATMRQLTRGYAPPEDACATFRGLYHGLAELEREMHLHVYLENHILFPRALRVHGVDPR
jgi:regulator of cell morphogenesis and NO signaling